MQNITIGLFGTCDGSKWRESFIDRYEALNIGWYNPDAGDDWHPGMVEDENRHLLEDHIILFPILEESLGQGSLAEVGFSVLNIVRRVMNGSDQTLVVLIADECTDKRKTEDERKTSNRSRKLVKSKLKEIDHPNIFLVNSLNEMESLSLDLFGLYLEKNRLKQQYCVY